MFSRPFGFALAALLIVAAGGPSLAATLVNTFYPTMSGNAYNQPDRATALESAAADARANLERACNSYADQMRGQAPLLSAVRVSSSFASETGSGGWSASVILSATCSVYQ